MTVVDALVARAHALRREVSDHKRAIADHRRQLQAAAQELTDLEARIIRRTFDLPQPGAGGIHGRHTE